MKLQYVKYHTEEWRLLVEEGWVTKEVNYGQGSWRIATMIKEAE